MQSLDSSCQEADFIINDTLKKLKGSSTSANSNVGNNAPSLILNSPTAAILRQQQQIAYQHLPNSTSTQHHKFPSYHHLQTALQGTSVSPSADGIRSDTNTEEKTCLQNVAQLQHLSPPTPPSLVSSSFSVTFPSKSSLIDNSLLHCNISQIPSQPPLCIFEDDEEPSNPTDQPPAELLATTTSLSSTSSLPHSASKSQNLESTPNFENIVLLPQPAPSNIINSSITQQIPIVHQSNQGGQSTTYSNFNSITSPSPTVPDLLLSTSPGVQSSALNNYNCNTNNNNNNYNINKKADKRPSSSTPTSSVSSSSAINHHSLQHIQNFQHNHNTHLSTSSPVVTGSPTSSPSKRQKIKDIYSTKGLHSSSLSRSISNSASSGLSIGQTITSNTTTTSSSTTSTSKKETSYKFFNIHERIKDHYLQLLANDLNLFAETGLKQRTRSFILERVVECERLNTIVINLYPGNKGYALALHYDDRQIFADNDLDLTTSPVPLSSTSSPSSLSFKNISSRCSNIMVNSSSISSSKLHPSSIPPDLRQKVLCDQQSNLCEGSANDIYSSVNEYSLVEVLRWPYENDQLLQCIDREIIPDFLMDMLAATTITMQSPQNESTGTARIYAKPNVFYAGCVVAQIRDFRQTFATSTNICDTRHVLLRPTNATLFAEVQHIATTLNQTASVCAPEDKLALESQLVLATAEPLCLDPDPNIGRHAINTQFERQLFNTHELRRQMKKYTQISINRKRKLDQFTHHYGLELSDYLARLRTRPRSCVGSTVGVAGNISSSNGNVNPLVSATMLSSFASKVPKRPREVLRPIRPPRLDYPANLKVPDQLINVEKYAKTNERPRETTDCQPQLIEEYILETERDDNEGRRVVYHIKLSIFQRPSNSEYLGELYVDRDYREGIRNGESCRFPLGTRVHANRYIQQFTEIFTEEGRKAVKITHLVPGHLPKITHTGITPEQRQALLLQQQQIQLQQHHQQQQRQAALLAAQQHVIQQTMTQPQPDQNQQQQHLVVVGPNGQQQHLLPTTVQHLNTNAINSQTQTVQHVSKNINIVNVSGSNVAAVQHVLRQQQLQPTQQVTTTQFIDTNVATVQLHHPTLTVTTVNNTNNTTTTTNSNSHNIQLQQLSSSASSTSSILGVNNSGASTTTHQLSLSNGSLVLVQQHPASGSQTLQQQAAHALQHAGITIQPASSQQQKTTQVVTNQLNSLQSGSNSSLRTQLCSNVPILQAQLKAAPLVTNISQTQLVHKQNTANNSTNALHITGNSGNSNCNAPTLQTNPAINAIVTSIMNSANQWQQQQQQTSVSSSNTSTTATSLKSSSNASILSLLNSAPAAMTSTPVASGTFTTSTGQTQQQQQSTQQALTLVQQSSHTQPQQQQSQSTNVVTTDFIQSNQSQVPNQPQRKQSEVLQNLLNPGRKINIVSSSTAVSGGTAATFRTNAGGSLIAVNLNQSSNHQPQQRHHHQQQQQLHVHQQQQTQTQIQTDQHQQTTVRVSMSALASQLASPPAIMTNSTNFGGYTLSTVSGTGTNAGSIKILNSGIQQQRALANALRRDSLNSSSQGPPNAIVVGVAAPSPGSDSNASNASGFAIPQTTTSSAGNSNSSNALNALLANTATPSPSGSEHSQSSQNQNQSLLERLNCGGVTTGAPLPNMSPQQHHTSQQQYIAKTLVQSPATSSIHSPMSSPHPQPSPSPHLPPPQQQQPPSQIQQQQQSQTQTATLNLQGINFSTLQGAISNFSGLQNVQVQIPGFNQPISLQLTSGNIQTVQQPHQSGNATVSVVSTGNNSSNSNGAVVSAQNNNLNQETLSHQRSLLVSVPVSSASQQGQTQHTITLQPQQLQQQHHGATATGTIVNLSSGAVSTPPGGSQAVVLSNNTTSGAGSTISTNSSGNGSSNTGTMLTLPIAQLVGPGVQKLNSATIRTTSAAPPATGLVTTNANTATAGSIIVQPQSSQQQKSSNQSQQATITVSSTAPGNQGNQAIQLVGTIQQGGRNIQVVGTKQLAGGRQLITQRSTLKIAAAAPINANSNTSLTSSANLTATPIVMSTQKLQLKTIKTTPQHQAQQQQHQRILNQITASQASHTSTPQQTQTQTVILGQQATQQSTASQHQQHIQIQARTGSNLTQRTISAITIAKQQQQQQQAVAAAAAVAAANRRRPTTDVSK